MLILKRDIRNKFLVKRIFKLIAEAAVQEVQSRFVKNGYGNRADALTKAIKESLAEALTESFEEKCPNYDQYVFLHLKQRITSFVSRYFEDDEYRQNNRSTQETINEQFEILISELYEDDTVVINEYRNINSEKKGSEKHNKMKTLSEHRNIDSEEKEFEKHDKMKAFVEKLLSWINDLTIKDTQPIVLEELRIFNSQEELDHYLLCWAQKHETEILKMELGNAEEKKQLIKNYLELVKRTYLLYEDDFRIRKNRAENYRENLAKKLARKAKMQYENFLNEDQYYYIYDQDKMKKAAFWELKKTDRSEKRFMEAMECIDSAIIMRAIQFSLTNYREVCADLIMCKWLGLSSFGYFRQAVALAPRMQGYAGQIEHGAMHFERIRTVLAVLASIERSDIKTQKGFKIKEIDLSKLQKNIWEYKKKTVICAKERIWTSMKLDDSLDIEDAQKKLSQFFEKVSEHIQVLEEQVIENKKIVWEESIWDRFYKKDSEFEEMYDYFLFFYKEANIFKRLYDMLDAYSRIQISNKLYVESEVFQHTLCIYRNATKGSKIHKVVKEVADFYNKPESEKKTNAQKMTDMLCFVQDYYYCNRIKKAGESKCVLGMPKA